MSSDEEEEEEEEDVHQCGRCKQLFYSLKQYFQHKKAKACHKATPEGGATRLRVVNRTEKGQTAERTGSSCEKSLLTGLDPAIPPDSEQPPSLARPDVSFTTISMEMADSLSLQQENRVVVAPAKKRLAAREMALKQPGSDGNNELLQKTQMSDVTVEKKVRGSKRRPTAKNMKKAWAENYKDSVEELTAKDLLIDMPEVEHTAPRVIGVQGDEAFERVGQSDVQPSLKRSRVLKGELSLQSGSQKLEKSTALIPSSPWSQDIATPGKCHDLAATRESSLVSKRKIHGRPKVTVQNSVRKSDRIRKSKRNASSVSRVDTVTKTTPQVSEVLDRSDEGEEGKPLLKCTVVVPSQKEYVDVNHRGKHGDKENQVLVGPSEEAGSDSECAVTVEQAVKRFIFTRGRCRRRVKEGSVENFVGKNWKKECHTMAEREQTVKKVQRRKRGLGYKCIACGFKTAYKSEYQRHMRKEHNMSMYTCARCSAEFKVVAKASRHVEEEGPCRGAQINHTPSNLGTLMLTKQKLESRTSLEERDKLTGLVFQVRFAYNEGDVELDVCRELCRGQQGIIALTMRCSECQYVAKSFRQAQAHFKQHWTYLPALCCFCGRCLPSRYRLIQHVSSFIHDHLTEDSLVTVKSEINQTVGADEVKHSNSQTACPKCNRKFLQSTGLAQHLISYHQVMKLEKKFYCGHCTSVFTKQDELMTHLKNQHQGELQACDYECPVCGRGFKVKSHALRHRECLHSPVQQVPYGVQDSKSSTLALAILCPEPSEDQHTCFICYQVFGSTEAYLEHVYQHRVWVPHPTRGAKPRDLFEQIVDSTDGSSVMKIRVKMELDLNSRLLSEEERDGLVKKVNMIAEKRRRKYEVKGLRRTRVRTGQPDTVTTGDRTSQVADAVSVLQSMADNIPKPSCTANAQLETCDIIQHSSFAMDTRDADTSQDRVTNKALVTNNDINEDSAGELLLKVLSHDDGGPEDVVCVQDEGSTMDVELEEVEAEEGEGGEEAEVEDKTQRLLCAFCLTLADTLQEMYNHIVHTHSLVATFRCVKSECGLNFDTVEEFEGHSRIHSQKAFICNICNWHMEKASQLQAHKAASHRSLHCLDTGHCCQVCHKTFVSQEALVQHINRDPHHHQCPHCSKVFKSKADLADHEMAHNSTKSLLCDQCGATFVNKLTLNRHRQVHSKRNHHCDLCPLSFNKREHLRRHLSTIHSSEKPHQCNYPGCGRRFKRKDKLQEHLKKHSPDKPYVCGLCGRRYRYREGLRYHEKTHNTEGHYQCNKCNVHFNRPSMLQQHLQQQHNVSTNKRLLYPCELCSMAFQRPERRSRHMERSHNITVDWPLRCDFCGRGFPGEKSFETHMKERHSNKGKKKSNKVEKYLETVDEGEKEEAGVTETAEKTWDVGDNGGNYTEKGPTVEGEATVGVQYQEDMVQQAINQTIQLEGYPLEYSNPTQMVHVIKPCTGCVEATGGGNVGQIDRQPEMLQWYMPPAVQPVAMADLANQGVTPANLATTFHMENLGPVSLVPGNQTSGSGIIQLNQPVLQLNTSQLVSVQGQGTALSSQASNTFMAAVGDAQIGFQLDPSTVVSDGSVPVIQDYGTVSKGPWIQSMKNPKTKPQQTPRKKPRPKKSPEKGKKSGQTPKIKIQCEGKDMTHSQLLLQLQQQALAEQQQNELRTSQQELMESQQDVAGQTFQPSNEVTHKIIPEVSATSKSGFVETNMTLCPSTINIQGQDLAQPVTTATNTIIAASQPATSYNTATLPRELTELLMKSIVSQIQKQQPIHQAVNRNVNLGPSHITGIAQGDNGQLKMTIRDLQNQEEKTSSGAENTSQLQQLLQGPGLKQQIILHPMNLAPSMGESSSGIQQINQSEGALVSGDAVAERVQEVVSVSDSHENSMRLPHQTQVIHWQADGSVRNHQQAELPVISQHNIPMGCTFTPQVATAAATSSQASTQLVQNLVPSIIIPVSSTDGVKTDTTSRATLQHKPTEQTSSLLYQQLIGAATTQQHQYQPPTQDVQGLGTESATQATFILNNNSASMASLTGQQTYVLATPSVVLSSSSQTPPTYLFTTGVATGGAGLTPSPGTQTQLILTQGPALSNNTSSQQVGSDLSEQMQQTYSIMEPYNNMKADTEAGLTKSQLLAL